ncbi:phosphoglycerate dehydrogenase [candidate division KSB1 bacterium]|nr:phosphoglycerate dehydrogenase [candidate division KSB1 bacterium]
MKHSKYFVIDFDSTFIKVEALEELAAISLKDEPDSAKVLSEIREITDAGLEGKLSFTDSLARRIRLLRANRQHLEMLIRRLQRKISTSIKRNKKFFRNYADQIYIVSGGFKEFIEPIAKQFGITSENIFANSFEFDDDGNITGFDAANILAQENGKVLLLKSLNLSGDIYVIGDGYTDYQTKEAGLTNKFYAFTENVKRESIVDKADFVAPSFDEFLYLNKLPMSISYPKNRINVLLLENIHPRAQMLYKEEGYQVETLNYSPDEKELTERIKQVSILGVRSKTRLNERILRHANRLIAIGAFCIGTEQLALDTCQQKGVAVFNAPFSNTRSVVEMVIGEIIVLIRKIFEKSNKLKQGIWEKTSAGSFEIRGKKLGIIGYGNIGSQLSTLAEFLGMEVYYYDIIEKMALGNAKKCTSMQQLLKKADIVTVHVDGNPNNRNLIGDDEFKLMKRGAIFLNLSRGFIVNLEALVKHLKNGRISGAAIDVFPREPKSDGEKFISQLQQFPNVIITPHIGGSTMEAQYNIAEFVPRNIIDYINSGNTFFSVNFPNLQLPQLQRAHRLIHIHQNVPGMLAQINSILAQHDINIIGQYLKTNELIGYVITDIIKKYDPEVITELKKIPHTIKFRILY